METSSLPKSLCCGIMRHLRSCGKPAIHFFANSEFADFKASLDSEIKCLQSKGMGSSKKRAEVLTDEEEEMLWIKGLLGNSSPQAILSMVFYSLL